MDYKNILAACTLAIAASGNATELKTPKQACALMPEILDRSAALVSQGSMGCSWYFPGEQKLEAVVTFERMDDAVRENKDMINNAKEIGVLTELSVCAEGQILEGDFGYGSGPGGVGYVRCPNYVISLRFQGTEAQRYVMLVAKRFADAQFQKQK